MKMNKEKKRKPNLIEDPIAPTLVKLTWPMVFGMFGSVIYNLTDTYFIGMLGVEELAAIGFTFPLIMFVSSIAGGIGIGTASLFSRTIVSTNQKVVQKHALYIFILSFILIVLFIGFGLITLDPVVRLLGASEELVPLVSEYMVIWYWAIIFVIIPAIGNNMIRATGNTFAPGMIMVFGNILNILLDPLLIFGWGPFPKMGLSGAALATAISMAVTCFLSLQILIYREKILACVKPVVKDMIDVWKKVLYVGLPAAMATLIIPFSIGFITRILSGFGTEAVAAFGVVSKLEMFAFTLIYALGSVLTVFAGQNWSAGKPNRIQKAINMSVIFSMGFGIIFLVISHLFATEIIYLFSDNDRVVQIASSYLKIVSFSYGFLSILMLCTNSLDGINKPGVSFILSIIRLIVLYVPLAWVTSEFLGLTGVFWSAFTANLLSGIIAYLLFKKIITKEINLKEELKEKKFRTNICLDKQ